MTWNLYQACWGTGLAYLHWIRAIWPCPHCEGWSHPSTGAAIIRTHATSRRVGEVTDDERRWAEVDSVRQMTVDTLAVIRHRSDAAPHPDARLLAALHAIAAPAEDAEPVHASPQWELMRLRVQIARMRRIAVEALE